MAVLEAMACGLPCLIARSPKSATSQFALSGAWLYRWDSTEALTARLDDLLDAPSMLRDARPLARMAAERYRIERSVAKLLDVYRELIDPKGAPEASPAVATG
jgi:1,2-diacylglycerol 3-alpha-glucosyltransferase